MNRIKETKWDTYPLDRMLPAYTVFNIFFQNYEKEEKKEAFLNNHRFLKLREGYYALIACAAFDEIENRKHYLIFPANDKNGDVGFIAEKMEESGEMEIIFFDVKEYHEIDKKTFIEYLSHIFSKEKVKNNHYGLIIALNRDTSLSKDEVKYIEDISKELSRGIFICSGSNAEQHNPKKGFCSYFWGGKLQYYDNLELSNKGRNENVIFQDEINYKI